MRLSRAGVCATMMLAAALGVLTSIAPVLANWTGQNASGQTITFFNANNCTSVVCVPIAEPTDNAGNPLFGAPGTTNPNNAAIYMQGVTGGVPIPTTVTGSLPPFANTPTFNCGTGCSGGTSTPFTSSGVFGTLTATTSPSSSTALPTNTGTVEFANLTSAYVSCTLASGSATGVVNNIILPPMSIKDIGVSGYSNVSCIDQTGSSGSNQILMAGGYGNGSGFGGGSSGGGGGGAITMASGAVASGAYSAGSFAAGALGAGALVDGADVTQGNKTDAPCTLPATTTACSGIALQKAQANAINSPGSPNVTLHDCSGTIASAGTAQNAISAQTTLHGFILKNIDASSGSGEPLWFSMTTTAAANAAASYPLAAPASTTFANGESFTAPPFMGTNSAVSVVAATAGHKYSCTWW